MQTLSNVKKYGKLISICLLAIISLPLIEVIIEIIFTYGNYVGTFARSLIENGVCL